MSEVIKLKERKNANRNSQMTQVRDQGRNKTKSKLSRIKGFIMFLL